MEIQLGVFMTDSQSVTGLVVLFGGVGESMCKRKYSAFGPEGKMLPLGLKVPLHLWLMCI